MMRLSLLSVSCVRRSLCSRARPSALGIKAIASPAADSTTPAPTTLTTTAVPATMDTPATPLPTTSMLARAPSEARSSTYTVPRAVLSTVLTTSTAPAVDSTTGTATTAPAAALAPTTTEATGRADTALRAEASDWALSIERRLPPA
jgi:hypothetical protein